MLQASTVHTSPVSTSARATAARATAARAIAAPRPIESPAPFRVPVVASIAPLVVALVLWLVTRSPYSLLFALLGPVTAVASVVDGRLGSRRARRRDRNRLARDSRAARGAVDLAHDDERASLLERTPLAGAILANGAPHPWRWGTTGPEVPVALGTGPIPSGVRIEGTDAELEHYAATLRDAPVVVDAALGIGVCGPPPLATAAARAVAVQVAWALSPSSHWIAAEEPWAAVLPHAAGGPPRPGVLAQFGRHGQREALVTIAAAESEASLPASCRVVVSVGADGAGIAHHPERARRGPVRPGLVSAESAHGWAAAIAVDALAGGLVAPAQALPDVQALAELPVPGGDRGLACCIGVDATGPVVLDLVAQGPHAVVGGTTGSGKSELLISWVLAMARAVPPERLSVLLVDFKGGSAFAALDVLPHTVGIVTDLDEARAARALASLSAELRHRERALADAQARDIDEVPGEPRLVIVVDEFAAMLAAHPALHALFADIASRGRSLGMHLVLCTQRPSGVVRDALLANADLRISLRVNNGADSAAVVGTDAAAAVPVSARGRGVLAPQGAEPRIVQFAIASESDVDGAASRWPASPPPRRPWLEPLPPVVAPEEAPDGFGLADLPHEQRREVARWDPRREGGVLVLGSARSGTSTALAALAPEGRWLPADVAGAWDALTEAEARLRHELPDGAERYGVLVVDDADSLLARFPQEYRAVAVERLAALLRDGPARCLHVALSAKRITADLVPLAALAPARLLLRHASKQDWVLAGGEGAAFPSDLPPGGGLWRGDRVQVVAVSPPDRPAHGGQSSVGELDRGRPLAVVTGRPMQLLLAGSRPLAEADLAALTPGDVVVGDVDEWQSRWGALGAARQVAEVVLDGCTPADVRALTRSRELPPPLTGLAGVAWRLEPDGTLSRVRFPPTSSVARGGGAPSPWPG